MIDLFITAYLRPTFTGETIRYLRSRTKYPYRLFLIDQGGNQMYKDAVDYYIKLEPTTNIHTAWNIAKEMAESEYFITSDNDIYVPDLRDVGEYEDDKGKHFINLNIDDELKSADWLSRMVKYMDERPDYAAISLHPHVLIGAASFDPSDPEDVKEVDHCGAVMRIMRTKVAREAGGWEHKLEKGRNHEERYIADQLHKIGFKVGRTTRLRAYHPFGKNWGYPEDMSPEEHGHRPELKEQVESADQPTAYDNKTWLPL